jgi:hypothetical protein
MPTASYNETKLDKLIYQIYVWNKTVHVSDSSSVIHQQFFTVHTAMVYVIKLSSSSVLILLANYMTYSIFVCSVKNS